MRRLIEIARRHMHNSRPRARRPLANRPQLALEPLETRKMLTGGISNYGNAIRVDATNDGDTIHVWTDLQNPKTTSDDLVRVEWTHDETTSKFSFPAGPIKLLQLNGGLSDDTIKNDTNLPSYIYGRRGNDRLTGGGVVDFISGGEDDDVIDGRGGADVLFGDKGSDVIHGGTGDDTIYGGKEPGFDDSIADTDKLYGDANNDRIQGSRGGTNYMYGGAGNDLMVGGFIGVVNSVNVMYGGDGNDSLYAPGRPNHVDGGKGMDYIDVAYFTYGNFIFGGDDQDMDIVNDEDDFDGTIITKAGDVVIHAKTFDKWPNV